MPETVQKSMQNAIPLKPPESELRQIKSIEFDFTQGLLNECTPNSTPVTILQSPSTRIDEPPNDEKINDNASKVRHFLNDDDLKERLKKAMQKHNLKNYDPNLLPFIQKACEGFMTNILQQTVESAQSRAINPQVKIIIGCGKYIKLLNRNLKIYKHKYMYISLALIFMGLFVHSCQVSSIGSV